MSLEFDVLAADVLDTASNARSTRAQPPSPRLPEETLIDGTDAQDVEEGKTVGNWSDLEIPEADREQILEKVPRDIRREVRRTRSGLGHPERTVFLHMLKIGGASPEALENVKAWNCPVRQAKLSPSKPQTQLEL